MRTTVWVEYPGFAEDSALTWNVSWGGENTHVHVYTHTHTHSLSHTHATHTSLANTEVYIVRTTGTLDMSAFLCNLSYLQKHL